MPSYSLDAAVVSGWCELALDALGQARAEIDAINVYPVADGDTGTNLYVTVESAARAVAAARAGQPTAAEAVGAMAHGALIGAHGNSGTILAQLLRGMAEVYGEDPEPPTALARALRRAAVLAYEAVAHPVEGTMLSVATAAADAAAQTPGDAATTALAAYEGARTALAATPDQLDVLARAGVVDAGGSGLVAVLGALAEALSGSGLRVGGVTAPPGRRVGGSAPLEAPVRSGGPAFEVIYLLEAESSAVRVLREQLDTLGDSLVVVGGEGLWNVHVHADDAGAAIEAGVRAGRPYRIRIAHLATPESAGGCASHPAPVDGRTPSRPRTAGVQRAVVVVVPGAGLAGLCAEAGATVVTAHPDEPPASGELAAVIRRTQAPEIVLLPNAATLRHTAAAAAEQARAEGLRVAVIPTRSPVQGLAALAVHEPERRFDEDVVAMTSAAGATRYAELTVAERQSWTTAGICQAGDVLGMVDGDVAVIGEDLTETATDVLDRMLAGGGELVTLVLGDRAPAEVAERLEAHVRQEYLAVDTVVYLGQQAALLLIGVE